MHKRGGEASFNTDTMDLQKFYRKILTKGIVDRIEFKEQPKGLSAKTVRNINQVISSAMNLAVAQKIILLNPTNACELPTVEHREMQTIPTEQLLKAQNSYRAVSISPQAIEVLQEQKRKTNDPYVFPSPNGGPILPDSVNMALLLVSDWLQFTGGIRIVLSFLKNEFHP